jgi:hypothetical protein
MGGRPPDFAGWSGYPSIAALSVNRGTDVCAHCRHQRKSAGPFAMAQLVPPQLCNKGYSKFDFLICINKERASTSKRVRIS